MTEQLLALDAGTQSVRALVFGLDSAALRLTSIKSNNQFPAGRPAPQFSGLVWTPHALPLLGQAFYGPDVRANSDEVRVVVREQ